MECLKRSKIHVERERHAARSVSQYDKYTRQGPSVRKLTFRVSAPCPGQLRGLIHPCRHSL